MFTESDLNNIVTLVEFAFAQGMPKSSDDAKVLLMLQNKAQGLLPQETPEEEENGDDVSAGD
jgi:hypothetical protein